MMFRPIPIFAIVILCLATVGVFGQSRPEWFESARNTIKTKEPGWKMVDVIVTDNTSVYGESIRMRAGAHTGAVEISAYNDLVNPNETFTGQVTVYDNIVGRKQTKTKLNGLGDEAYMWSPKNADDYTTVMFKKGKTFVSIFLPGRSTAQRFAGHIAAHIP